VPYFILSILPILLGKTMRLGSPFSAGLGSPENMVEYCLPELAADQTSVRLRFKPRAGWGDAFFAVFMDARQVAHLW
jgi:hypothetical protein